MTQSGAPPSGLRATAGTAATPAVDTSPGRRVRHRADQVRHSPYRRRRMWRRCTATCPDPQSGAAPTQTVPGSWFGYPRSSPSLRYGTQSARGAAHTTAERIHRGWIPASDATVSVDHLAVVVDLATMQLSVFKHGRLIEAFPAGIGKPTSPTPPGDFVAMKAPAPESRLWTVRPGHLRPLRHLHRLG